MGTPKGHTGAKETSRYAQLLRRKTHLKKNFWCPLAAKPNGGGDPCRVWGAGWPRAIICKSFIDLGRRVRPLGDLVEISIWPYTKKMHVLNRTRNGSYTRTRAQMAKRKKTESEKKLLHISMHSMLALQHTGISIVFLRTCRYGMQSFHFQPCNNQIITRDLFIKRMGL